MSKNTPNGVHGYRKLMLKMILSDQSDRIIFFGQKMIKRTEICYSNRSNGHHCKAEEKKWNLNYVP